MKLKNYYWQCYQRSGFCFISFTNFSPMFSLPEWLNYEILNGPPFWAHYTPQAKPFWKSARYFTTPTWSVPPLFDHSVQVFNSAKKADLLALHFKRIHHLNLHVATAKHAHMVNCTINKYFCQFTNPYELRCLIRSLKTKCAQGTDSISATMLRNLSHKALIHLTQLFNLIPMFGYFPYARKSAKVIPILEPGKPLSDPGSHRPISLLSRVSKLPERVVAHRLNSFIHQNHILPSKWFGFHKQCSTVSQLARITAFLIHGFNLRMVSLDTEKAYNTVWLNGLLCKLISLQLPDSFLP
jgi:hypothetical protein